MGKLEDLRNREDRPKRKKRLSRFFRLINRDDSFIALTPSKRRYSDRDITTPPLLSPIAPHKIIRLRGWKTLPWEKLGADFGVRAHRMERVCLASRRVAFVTMPHYPRNCGDALNWTANVIRKGRPLFASSPETAGIADTVAKGLQLAKSFPSPAVRWSSKGRNIPLQKAAYRQIVHRHPLDPAARWPLSSRCPHINARPTPNDPRWP